MIKEDLEERFGDKWEIHAFLMIGVAASRRQRRLTPAEAGSGMVLVLLAANLEELADKLAAQPDSRTPVTRLTAQAIGGVRAPNFGWSAMPGS
ncbi:hypothetical protein AB0L53_31290 [Nonomuraea sp. NPDC052129]|uniref:hypothetical protein n=1 Tax=Nonomuraea sp. NPDC052129 TaxID=3154651 RepID=UPI00342D1D11